MANRKICKVCGKEYEPCRSIRPTDSVFNWRVVACSPQCGQEYFRQVTEARGKADEPAVITQHYKVIDPVDVTPAEVFDENAEIETFFN